MIGTATDSYTTIPLEHLSSALLRFTPIRSDRPTLVGSDLHLSIGATEIDDIRVSASSVNIVFNPEAGAQNGSLTFHSTKALEVESTENCEVTSVDKLGDNLWKLNIGDRKWGQIQSIVLRIVAARGFRDR